MRHFRLTFLLGLLSILALAPACHNSRSNQLAALAAVIVYTNPVLANYVLTQADTYPKKIDTLTIKHTGTEGDVEFDLQDPSGALQASPASGVLRPGEQAVITVLALGYTYARAILTMQCLYAVVLGSTDHLRVPFNFVLNGGALPALATIMAITNPTVFRHLLSPQLTYPYFLDFLTIQNNAKTGPAVNYALSDQSGSLGGVPLSGTLAPGQSRRIDIRALQHKFALATLTLTITYAIIGSSDRLVRKWDFRNAAPPSLAALVVISLITGQSALVPNLFWPALILALIGVIVVHSKGGLLNKVPLLLFTEIALVGVMTFVLTVAMLQANFWRSKTSQNLHGVAPIAVNFPPGQGPNGYTIHPNLEQDMTAGSYHMFHMTVEKNIPIKDTDPKNKHVYSFVMDSDASATNNWVPFPAFPNDFFKDTDRWYQVQYDATSGWTMSVTQVDAQKKTTAVKSAARAIIRENAVVLVVPASEFKSAKPKWRATSFVHQGDFGLNPPHVWSGDLMPPVKDGLLQMK